jgi:alpha-L-fucosidase
MSGFCLWDSKGYDYDVAASGNKTDVVAEFVAACKEYAIRPGFYYCILDPHNEGKFDWNSRIPDKYFDLPSYMAFGDPGNYDTYDIFASARLKEPDPAEVDAFIKTQISPQNQEELREWIR